MRTLPREPWRGGQICGEQLEYGVVPGRSVFCGEFKKLGSPVCEQHDKELREDNYGVLPKFAPGNATGLEITFCSQSWLVRDEFGVMLAASEKRITLVLMHGFDLQWEGEDGEPVDATLEELAAWDAQLKENVT